MIYNSVYHFDFFILHLNIDESWCRFNSIIVFNCVTVKFLVLVVSIFIILGSAFSSIKDKGVNIEFST